MRTTYVKECPVCKSTFETKSKQQIYCSKNCCSKASYERVKNANKAKNYSNWAVQEKGTTSVRLTEFGKVLRVYKMPWYDKFTPIIKGAMESHTTYGKYVAKNKIK